MDRCAHRPCCLWFFHLRGRLTKLPQIAVLAGWGLVTFTAGIRVKAASGLLRLVQVSCGWPRVGRALDMRAPAGTSAGHSAGGLSAHPEPRGSSGASFCDFCTPAASRGGPSAYFRDFLHGWGRGFRATRPFPRLRAGRGRGSRNGEGLRPAETRRRFLWHRGRATLPALPRGDWLCRVAVADVQKSKKVAPRPLRAAAGVQKSRKHAPFRRRLAGSGGLAGRASGRASCGPPVRRTRQPVVCAGATSAAVHSVAPDPRAALRDVLKIDHNAHMGGNWITFVLKIGHSEFPGGNFQPARAGTRAGALFHFRRNRRSEGVCLF